MSGVFDRLQKKLDVQKHEEGISALDIADLPANLRKIMRLMLRKVEIFYVDLWAEIERLPEESRLSQPQLDEALETLTSQGWLIRRGEGDRVNYRVNLRRKRGSQIAQGIWGALDAKIEQTKQGGGEETDTKDDD